MFQTFTIETASHLIQVALTPVFLLSGIAALLNVFASRLARVADHLENLDDAAATVRGEPCTAQQKQQWQLLHRQSLALDAAVVSATAGAAATCLAILTLFLFALSNRAIAGVLVAFFGLAILCTLGSVVAFGLEMLMSSKGLRQRIGLYVPRLNWLGRAKPHGVKD